jgi:hypothetical protein
MVHSTQPIARFLSCAIRVLGCSVTTDVPSEGKTMTYSIRSLLILTIAVGCWSALALQLRALAILILPIAASFASVYATFFSARNRSLRPIYASIAILSLVASYVALLGPFYLFCDWDPAKLSFLGTSIRLLFDPLMEILPRHAPKLWDLIMNQYLLEWIEYRRYVLQNPDPYWPYRSL